MIERPENKNLNLSRREFDKLMVLAGISGLTLFLVGGYKLLEALGYIDDKSQEPFDQLGWFKQEMEIFESNRKMTSRPPTDPDNNTETALNFNLQKERGLFFGDINFINPELPINMLITTKNDDRVEVFDFLPFPKDVGLDEEKIFEPTKNTTLAKKDESRGRIVLWIHSGQKKFLDPYPNGFPMSELQKLIEYEGTSSKVSIWEANRFLKDVIRGSEIVINQDNKKMKAVIAAAVRVPPDLVDDHSANIDRLPEWISETFEDTGFENLLDRSDVLIPKFCGMYLPPEDDGDYNKTVQNYSFVEKSRFILGIVPA
jgi:hypothetical protein